MFFNKDHRWQGPKRFKWYPRLANPRSGRIARGNGYLRLASSRSTRLARKSRYRRLANSRSGRVARGSRCPWFTKSRSDLKRQCEFWPSAREALFCEAFINLRLCSSNSFQLMSLKQDPCFDFGFQFERRHIKFEAAQGLFWEFEKWIILNKKFRVFTDQKVMVQFDLSYLIDSIHYVHLLFDHLSGYSGT